MITAISIGIVIFKYGKPYARSKKTLVNIQMYFTGLFSFIIIPFFSYKEREYALTIIFVDAINNGKMKHSHKGTSDNRPKRIVNGKKPMNTFMIA